jgi:acyl CoA:acetate/3-ketoacid CoA transferase
MAYGNLATMTMENKCEDKQDKARRLKAQNWRQGLIAHLYRKHNTIQYEVISKHGANTPQFCMQ